MQKIIFNYSKNKKLPTVPSSAEMSMGVKAACMQHLTSLFLFADGKVKLCLFERGRRYQTVRHLRTHLLAFVEPFLCIRPDPGSFSFGNGEAAAQSTDNC